MSKPSRKLTPRSKVEELKALRSSHKKMRSTTAKAETSKGANILSAISNILNSSDNQSLNTTLVVNKPSVPLIPISKLTSIRAARSKHAAKGLNSSRKMSQTQKSQVVPKPPSQERPRESSRRVSNLLTPRQHFERMELPLNPVQALKHFKQHLTIYEQSEIADYPEIYYLGLNAPKEEPSEGANFGFDDSHDDYKLFKHEHIAYRFEILKLLGRGSFGQVCQCLDHKTKDTVAVKIIKNHKRFRYQAGVEVKLLRTIRENDKEDTNNLVKIRESFEFRNHVCLTFELLNTNLYDLLKTNNFKGFSLKLIRRFAIQILVGLSFIKRLKIIHCDLKPENILLKQAHKSGVKIIDFGSACLETEKMYSYIQSRFYRAPEIILGVPYTSAIDMWSFGCILAELFTGNSLLQGENEAEQLRLIMELRGLPPRNLLDLSSRKKLFFNSNDTSLVAPKRKNLQDIVRTKETAFVDLIDKCLEWDPKKRITPELALGHPWITEAFRKARKSKGKYLLNSKGFINL